MVCNDSVDEGLFLGVCFKYCAIQRGSTCTVQVPVGLTCKLDESERSSGWPEFLETLLRTSAKMGCSEFC